MANTEKVTVKNTTPKTKKTKKFTVNCYYTFVGTVEVEAESIEEAFAKGYNFCTDMPTDELQFGGYANATVVDESGEVYEMQ